MLLACCLLLACGTQLPCPALACLPVCHPSSNHHSSTTHWRITPTTLLPGLPACPALQVIKSQAYGKASDVYAFGLIMWELLSWQLPYEDLSSFQVSSRGSA
jgi:serine/threonine protein kinase